MSDVKSLRIPESLLKTIRELARRERLDEAKAIRKLIEMGATEYAVQLYRDGKVTLRGAAAMAETTLREMIEILLEHGVKGNVTVGQARKALVYALAAQGSPDQTKQS
jgi:predicted HTH domain antitoxin